MTWDGPERRKDFLKMSEIEHRVTTLETKLEERFNAHDEKAFVRQKLTCDKLDLIFNKIKTMDDRCFGRTELYILAKQHLDKSDSLKSIWSDRKFKLLLLIIGGFQGGFTIFIAWLLKTMIKSQAFVK